MAADHGMRTEALRRWALWAVLTPTSRVLDHWEDNQACIQILTTGKTQSMSHLSRTHKICLGWVLERYKDGTVKLLYCDTNKQAADIFTKAFTSGEKWGSLLRLICHVYPDAHFVVLPTAGGGGV